MASHKSGNLPASVSCGVIWEWETQGLFIPLSKLMEKEVISKLVVMTSPWSGPQVLPASLPHLFGDESSWYFHFQTPLSTHE